MLDPAWPQQHLLTVLRSAQPSMVVYISSLNRPTVALQQYQTQSLQCRLVTLSSLLVLGAAQGGEPVQPAAHHGDPGQHPSNSEVAQHTAGWLLFTSGSTGEPQGVRGSQSGILNRHAWMMAHQLLKKASARFHIFQPTQHMLKGHPHEALPPAFPCEAPL